MKKIMTLMASVAAMLCAGALQAQAQMGVGLAHSGLKAPAIRFVEGGNSVFAEKVGWRRFRHVRRYHRRFHRRHYRRRYSRRYYGYYGYYGYSGPRYYRYSRQRSYGYRYGHGYGRAYYGGYRTGYGRW